MNKGIVEYHEGDAVELFLLVKSAKKAVASNGKPFMTLILQDASGTIEAKLWDSSTEDEKNYVDESIVKIAGEITSFRQRKQLKIKTIRLATAEDGVKAADFVKTAPLSVETMGDTLTQYIFAMDNPHIQRLTRQLLKDHQEAFFSYPAATMNHHEFFLVFLIMSSVCLN